MGVQVGSERSKAQSSVVYYNQQFYVAFQSDDSSNRLLVTRSRDLANWERATDIGQTTKAAPTLVVAAQTLAVIFVANDNSNRLLVSRFNQRDGFWEQATEFGETGRAVTAIGLSGLPVNVGFNNVLVLFQANDPSDRLLSAHIFVE